MSRQLHCTCLWRKLGRSTCAAFSAFLRQCLWTAADFQSLLFNLCVTLKSLGHQLRGTNPKFCFPCTFTVCNDFMLATVRQLMSKNDEKENINGCVFLERTQAETRRGTLGSFLPCVKFCYLYLSIQSGQTWDLKSRWDPANTIYKVNPCEQNP